jgi:hypothetical protein
MTQDSQNIGMFPWERHSEVVLFANFSASPEDFIHNLCTILPSSSSLSRVMCVFAVEFFQSWDEHTVSLHMGYLLSRGQGAWAVEKMSLFDLAKSPRPASQGDSFVLLNKTITVNFDPHFVKKTKALFEEQEGMFLPSDVFLLKPVFIPKPWGQEIWFSGVEKRGVSLISSFEGASAMCQPWFFALLPKRFLGEKYAQKHLTLIKILDPLAQEVTGDLYYELHQEKNEVYVVTDISAPKGRIKMGISEEKLQLYHGKEQELKQDFLAAIKAYESVRREIDALLDTTEKEKIPATLVAQEKDLRAKMDAFTGYLDLAVGDVIRVPTHLPHALQHGVKVVEFQTPTYERLIVSFAQKVLTQSHWDTEKALSLMTISPPKKTILPERTRTAMCCVEEVCSFPDFYACRVTTASLFSFELKACGFYRIVYVVSGVCEFGLSNGRTRRALPGQCVFVPAEESVSLLGEAPGVFLLCAPEEMCISIRQ